MPSLPSNDVCKALEKEVQKKEEARLQKEGSFPFKNLLFFASVRSRDIYLDKQTKKAVEIGSKRSKEIC